MNTNGAVKTRSNVQAFFMPFILSMLIKKLGSFSNDLENKKPRVVNGSKENKQ